MKDYRWMEWIHSQLKTDPIEPASDDFYEGVWKRIGEQESSLSHQGRRFLPDALGAACWKAAPLFAASLLGILLYGWLYPPEMNGRTSFIESYVCDAGSVPSDGTLMYQILNVEAGIESEEKP